MIQGRRKSPPPGFSFCNPLPNETSITYMSQHGQKIRELFCLNQQEGLVSWQTVVLEQLIKENKAGFFVTDLEQLQDLTSNLFKQLSNGNSSLIPFLKQIISLSVVPFRKISNGDDRRCFPYIGGFFASLCPIIKLPYPDLQIEAAKALYWFSIHCGPMCTCENSTFRTFFPQTDDNALYSLIPSQLNVPQVIGEFCSTFIELLEALPVDPSISDLLTLCFKCLFEFVKRGQASHIPSTFVNNVLSFVTTYSEFRNNGSQEDDEGSSIACPHRVFCHALLFFDSFIQESSDAMAICTSATYMSSLWNLFVESFFLSFKNVQKRIRNEILGIIILCFHHIDNDALDQFILAKLFDLLQTITQLPLDIAATITYSNKTRKVRLTHEQVDVELILLSQDLLLALNQKCILPNAQTEFIIHQISILKGDINKYLAESQYSLNLQALQLLRAYVYDVNHFKESGGYEILISIMTNSPSDQTLFFALLLSLEFSTIFSTHEFIKTLLSIPQSNPQILSLILSLLASVIQNNSEMVNFFCENNGIDLLKQCFVHPSAEVVISSIDCARSIAKYKLESIDQRFVFMLLDCAENAAPLIRYGFVGLFLDLMRFSSFISSALLWRSLKSSSNIQRTIVRWWRQEEERLGIKYDKCIIIDADKPLEGHPLIAPAIQVTNENKEWLLDRNNLPPPGTSYKLDFRARLYLLLSAFPPLNPEECKPTDRIKELMIRNYQKLKKGSVWSDLKQQLQDEKIKPLHNDKVRIEQKLSKMRERSLDIQEKQCEIWQQYEDDRLALEKRTYNQLAEGLKTAQYVAENYKAIVNSQPVIVSRPFQGRTVKGEDVLVKTGNLRSMQKSEVRRDVDKTEDLETQREREIEENYINDCLKDESISYLVQLMKNSGSPERIPLKTEEMSPLST